MRITPLDIRKQEFSKKMRGFDTDEVRSFLEMVAGEYERALAQLQKLNKRLEVLESKISEYREMESTLQEAMMNAQKAGRSAEEESAKRSELIIQQAQLQADKIVHEARKKHQRLLDDIHRLEGQRRSFLLKMKQILKGQVELLEILENETPETVFPGEQAQRMENSEENNEQASEEEE